MPIDRNSTLSKTASGFGYGNKMDLTKANLVARNAFGTYNLKGGFDEGKDRNKGFNFGTPRENMRNTLRNNLSADKKIRVGPGQYSDHEQYTKDSRFKRSGSCFSAWSTKRFKTELGTQLITPGPQRYSLDVTNLKKDGKEVLSNYKSSGCTRFNPVRSQSTGKFVMNPGPGQYTIQATINEKGVYALSNNPNSPVRTFSKSQRKGMAPRDNFPGPGSYKPCTVSEFSTTKK